MRRGPTMQRASATPLLGGIGLAMSLALLPSGVWAEERALPRLGAEVPTTDRPQRPFLPSGSADAATSFGTGIPWSDAAFDDVVAVGNSEGWHCSGVLIDRLMVLTARHCLPVTRVIFGADAGNPQALRAVRAVQTPAVRSVDAALLLLSTAVDIPVAARRSSQDNNPPASFLRAVGFGRTSRLFHRAYGRKRFVETYTVGWGCTSQRAADSSCDPDAELTLSGGVNRDTCRGDSGGPLFERVGDERRLLAITSRAASLEPGSCGGGGVYVRLDRLDDWLQRAMAQLRQITNTGAEPK